MKNDASIVAVILGLFGLGALALLLLDDDEPVSP